VRLNSADTSALSSHGHLNPGGTPPVARYLPEPDLRGLIRHYWVPEWSLPDGVSVTADILGFAALNIVAERRGVILFGPTTRSSSRTLEGRGWAVGALLRPAATIALGYDAASLVDGLERLDVPDLLDDLVGIMDSDDPAGIRHGRATQVLGEWVRRRAAEATPYGDLANRFEELIEHAEPGMRSGDLALALAVSERTLQRAVRRTTGFSPAQVLRRHRLQEVAARLRTDAPADLADLAAEAGYADHAHMTREVREMLATTPSHLRAARLSVE
jgi:AraC-like DNA-binding protein